MKVLYILGKGRSGSTLLDTILGEVDGFFAAGELWHLWEALDEGYACGCGRPVDDCPVWGPVTQRSLGRHTPIEVRGWSERIFNWARAPGLLAAARGWKGSPELLRYTEVTKRMYEALEQVTGARVIVDSSKWPIDPVVLGLIPDMRVWGIHLIRDPRAVAHSWQRHKQLRDRSRPSEMPRYSPLSSAASWVARSIAADRLGRRLGPGRFRRLRYEDLVADPERSTRSILRFLGEPAGSLSFIEGDQLRLSENHTVLGNPIRFRTGKVRIRLDDGWLSEMPVRQQRLVTAVALPLLRRYRYPGRPWAMTLQRPSRSG